MNLLTHKVRRYRRSPYAIQVLRDVRRPQSFGQADSTSADYFINRTGLMAGKSPTMTTTATAQTTTAIKHPTNIVFTFTGLCFAHLTLAAIINITAARLALVVAMNKHAGHSRATARAGVVGFRNRENRHCCRLGFSLTRLLATGPIFVLNRSRCCWEG